MNCNICGKLMKFSHWIGTRRIFVCECGHDQQDCPSDEYFASGQAVPIIRDIKDMPGFNDNVSNGTDSVSKDLVYWDDVNKGSCRTHGAMLCVSKDRRIWRCPACHVGLYVEDFGDE